MRLPQHKPPSATARRRRHQAHIQATKPALLINRDDTYPSPTPTAQAKAVSSDKSVWQPPSKCSSFSQYSCYARSSTVTCPVTMGNFGCNDKQQLGIDNRGCLPPDGTSTDGYTYIPSATKCPGAMTAAVTSVDLKADTKSGVKQDAGWTLCCPSGYNATSTFFSPEETSGLYCVKSLPSQATVFAYPVNTGMPVCDSTSPPSAIGVSPRDELVVQVFGPSVYIGGPQPTTAPDPIFTSALPSASSPPPPRKGLPLGKATGIGVGIGCAIAFILLLIVACLYRRRRLEITEIPTSDASTPPHTATTLVAGAPSVTKKRRSSRPPRLTITTDIVPNPDNPVPEPLASPRYVVQTPTEKWETASYLPSKRSIDMSSMRRIAAVESAVREAASPRLEVLRPKFSAGGLSSLSAVAENGGGSGNGSGVRLGDHQLTGEIIVESPGSKSDDSWYVHGH